MFPGLPRVFPNPEWGRLEDVFRFYGSARSNAVQYRNLPPAEVWVQQELQYYESSFCRTEQLCVSVTTFNVGCKKPHLPMNDLAAVQFPDHLGEAAGKPVDIIVLALQEVDMSASAMFKEETDASQPWIQGACAAVGADSDPSPSSSRPYYALPPKQLVGLLLCVFVRRALVPVTKEFTITTVATGALGSLGNKGAVGVHLTIHCTDLCIITAHLAAGQNNVSKRNEDINSILKNMDFNATKRAEVQANANAGIVPEMLYPELFPRDHDFIIVAGDLNYRLNLSYEEAVGYTNRGEIAELLKYDQLAAELKNPHTPWKDFRALTPNHVPTYRFDIGTDNYDTSEKHRVPSFTDRICLWAKRPATQQQVHVDEHIALMQVRSSDHKPVRALLRLPVQVEVPEEKEKVLASLRQKVSGLGLDRAASSKVSVDATMLDFGQLQFHHCGEVRTVVLTNTGDSVAVVRVLRQKPPQNEAEDGAWTRVSPLEFAVLPGESQEVRIETAIDPRCMGWLSRWRPYKGNGRVAISAMLLFAVRNGPVQAVDCRAVLLPSVFANSLENISMLGTLPCVEAYQTKMDDKTLLQSLRPQIPKELWFLADAVQRQPRMKDLFAASLDVDSDVCHAIMAHIDTKAAPLPAEGEPGSFNVYCVCDCILSFLKNLQEPVVPYNMYTHALAAGKAKGKTPLAFIAQLPNAHANVWIYIVALLNYLLRPEHAQYNQLTPSLLAYVFSAAMIVRPVADQGLTSARLLQGGGVDQQVRQQLHQEREDAKDLVEYFLTAAPSYLQ